MTPRSRALTGAAAAVLMLALSACGSSSNSPQLPEAGVTATPKAEITATPAADAKVIAMTITSSTVDPIGATADVSRNQPVVLQISAQAAGQLHVHSTPQQNVDFPAGDSQVTLTFDKPGTVDIEDHALNQLIVQVRVN